MLKASDVRVNVIHQELPVRQHSKLCRHDLTICKSLARC